MRSDKVSYLYVCVSFKSEIGTLVELIRNEIGSFVERWMDLESVVQSEVKSEREKLCINAYIWNLEKWHRWTYFQVRNRGSDIENRHVDTAGKGIVGQIGRLGLTYMHCCCCCCC